MIPPINCELTHSYNPVSRAWESRGKLVVEISDDTKALFREVPDKIWRTLCFAALRMEPTGRCYVTAEELARDMGITRAQAAKRLQELAEWEYQGNKVLVPDGEGYALTMLSGNRPLLDTSVLQAHESRREDKPRAQPEELPTTQDLIRELTRKLHKLPGVQPQKGNYSLIGRALNTYGYEAVSDAIEDLLYEFDLREQLGKPVPTGSELAKLLMQRSAWNKKSLDAGPSDTKNLWDYYTWNEAGNQLVPTVPDPPFLATVVGGKIVVQPKTEGVEV